MTTTPSLTVSIFGNVLNSQQALSGNVIVDAIWDGTSWLSWIVDAFIAPNYEGFRTVPINLAGATVTITNADKQVQYFTGSGVLAGNYSVTFSGTFREGQTFYLKVPATLTIGASVLTFFGENINTTTAAGGNYTIIAWYDLLNTTFRTQLIASPPSAAGYNAPTDLAVPVIGINYPAASAGDTFRLVCAGEEGRIGAIGTVLPYPEPPTCKRVQNNQMMYCLTNTAGGNEAAAGTSFWIPDFPQAFMPIDITNTTGSSNYRLNIPGNPSSANTVGAGTNVGNVFIGSGNAVSGSSIYNWIVGLSHSLVGALYNLVGGRQHTFGSGSTSNVGAGYLNHTTGDNNVSLGQQNTIIGDDNAIVGAFHNGSTNRSMILGAGVQPSMSNTIYLGGSTSPVSSGGVGGIQSQLTPIGGSVTTVTHPSVDIITIGTNHFLGSGDSLLIPSGTNGTLWSFEARMIVVQTAVGADHPNTSTIGDAAEYVVTGVVRRSGGASTLVWAKWLDHRNRWIPLTSPSPLCYRNIFVTDGTQADICLVRPTVAVTSNTLTFSFMFPGFAEQMTDNGAGTTPQFAEYLTNAEINGGAALTFGGVAATDSEMPNMIIPTITTAFRNPVVDIFDGSDANGNGYYGGIGIGAEASAITDVTSVASLGYYNHGSYTIGVVATMTFDAGNATGVCVMSGVNDVHIGNNVVVVTGGTYTAANGNYAVVFAGGFGAGATGTATIVANVITAVSITNGGSGYHSGDVITITCPAGGETIAATFTYTLYEEVTSVTLGGANNNYTSATVLTTTFAGAGLAQAVATAQLTPNGVDNAGTITVNKGGVGYGLRFPTVAVFDGGGILYEDGNGGNFRASGHIIISQVKYI
jgi:hypothetical protein